jgi:membrane peptidoglycan carboxypeptidase
MGRQQPPPAWPSAGQPQRQYTPQPPPPPEGETELLPLVEEDQHYQREPELLTHREDEFEEPEQPAAAAPTAAVAHQREPEPDEKRSFLGKLKSMPRGKKIRRGILGAAAVFILGPIIGFFIAYQVVDVPSPEQAQAQLDQPVSYFFADKSLIAKNNGEDGNRVVLKDNQIPDTIKHAAYAAEDSTFESNSGFDLLGIARAAWNQVSGGSGGGSTITQQYIKQATGNDQHSYLRKAVEVVKAYKMNNEQSKADIITAYLNTIYFGRGAYGVQAAAKAYFNTDVAHLTKPQAALLGGMIQGPGRSEDDAYRTRRVNYVMDQMVKHHWMSPAERAKAQAPKLIKAGSNKPKTALDSNPSLGFVKNQVDNELASKGLDAEALRRSGAKIYTSIDPKAQQDARQAAKDQMQAEHSTQPYVTSSQVSINPSNGDIVAYYGGEGASDKEKSATAFDLAQTPRAPGSTFKPLVLAAAMAHDPKLGLGSTFDGTTGQKIAGQLINNSDGEGCGPVCPVKQAMTKSINTVFARMGAQAQLGNVRDAAIRAGIPDSLVLPGCGKNPIKTLVEYKEHNGTCTPEGPAVGLSIGQYPVRPIDMAQAYATIANNGNYLPAHFVTKVTDSSGENVLYQYGDQGKPAFTPDDPARNAKIARNVTQSMTDVAAESKLEMGGRPNATKTGTAQYLKTKDNSAAWTIGYTPQVVSAVWVGDWRGPKPIYSGQNGGSPMYGRMEPGHIYQDFMNNYLQGMPYADFGPFEPLGQQLAPPQPTQDNSQATQDNQSTPTQDSPPTTTENKKPDKPSNQSTPTKDKPTKTKSKPTHTTKPTSGGGPILGGGGG